MTEASTRRAVGRAAVILMAGNLAGSLLGFVRQSTVTAVFGQGAGTDAFFATSVIPQMFYDLTIGAAVSAALIPSLTEIAERAGAASFRRVLGSVLGLAWVVLAVVVLVLVILAGPLVHLLLGTQHCGSGHRDLVLAVRMARVLIPTLLFLGSSAVFLSGLYALRRFTVSAFAGSFYHLGVIAGALLLARPLGAMALPTGAVAGSVVQAAIQVLPLARRGALPVPRLSLSPEVRQILKLYAPVAAGLLVSVAGQVIDINLKWRLTCGGLTAMQQATTLVQFPIGIAVAALGYAVLPSISADAAAQRMDDFKRTLAAGFRFVLFLTIPASLGYIALATPIVSLLFQHGRVTPTAVGRITTALVGYSIQIPFVGVDQLLIFAFYARKNTVTPMLVGVVGVGIYVGSALFLLPRYHILGLALANTIQNAVHALILAVLLVLTIGPLSGFGVTRATIKALTAGLIMVPAASASASLLRTAFPATHLTAQFLRGVLPIVIGAIIYLAASALLRNAELVTAFALLRRSRNQQVRR